MAQLREYNIYTKFSDPDKTTIDTLMLDDYEVKNGYIKRFVKDMILDALLNVERVWVILDGKVVGNKIIKK